MKSKSYAILIDGDNINVLQYKRFIEYITNKGDSVQSVHLFGKLKSPFLAEWKNIDDFIGSVVTYDVSANKKNSTDMRMCSTIFNLYHEHGLRTFGLLSSDSDMLTVIENVPKDANFLIGFSRFKVASAYLNALTEQHIQHVDLDGLIEELSPEEIKGIINNTLLSYLRYKLSPSYFSYDAVRDWILDRYPCLSAVSVDEILNNANEVTLSFSKDGVEFKRRR